MKSQSVQVNNTHKGGFTLIELLVVIIIMTILTGISAGLFTGANEKLEIQKAANSLLIMAQYARMSAVEQQRAYKLFVDNANQEFYLSTTLVDEERGTAQDIIIEESLCAPVTLEGAIAIEDVRVLSNDYDTGRTSNNIYVIVFAPDGTAQSSVVQIGNGKFHYTLSVNEVTGKSKLYTGTIEDVKIDTIDIDAV